MLSRNGRHEMQMELAPGVADPMFLCELALEMGMPVSELGQRMSNYELCVLWPAYRQAQYEEAEIQQRGRQ